MLRNLFIRRLIYDNTVYLLIEDCADVLEIEYKKFHNYSNNILGIPGIGEAITEDEYNRIVSEHFHNNKDALQFTRVETLEIEKNDILKLYPIKRMFAENMFMQAAEKLGMTVEEYIDSVDYPNELEKEKEKMKFVHSIEEKIQKYQDNFEKYMPSREILEMYELKIQTLTVLNKHIGFMTFLVGDGIFYSLDPEYAEDDDWYESTTDNEGNITIPSWQYTEGKYEIKRNKLRDFRKYSVLENILYVIQNVIPKDEWQDYFEFRANGINLSLNKNMLMKFINPKYLANEYYFDGVPNIKSIIYKTGENV